METEPKYDLRRYFAAKSPRTLEDVCKDVYTRFGERYALREFEILFENEDQDIWEWGWSSGHILGFKIDTIGRYMNPTNWTWFWGAPNLANFRIIIDWDSTVLREDVEILEIRRALPEVFGCQLIPVPRELFG